MITTHTSEQNIYIFNVLVGLTLAETLTLGLLKTLKAPEMVTILACYCSVLALLSLTTLNFILICIICLKS